MVTLKKKYSPEEKARIALEALKGNLTQSQITSKYGVHSTQINNWTRQVKNGIKDIFGEKRKADDMSNQALIDELYKQIGQQKVEIDFLKKKSDLFA